jgi:hypothetical protein
MNGQIIPTMWIRAMYGLCISCEKYPYAVDYVIRMVHAHSQRYPDDQTGPIVMLKDFQIYAQFAEWLVEDEKALYHSRDAAAMFDTDKEFVKYVVALKQECLKCINKGYREHGVMETEDSVLYDLLTSGLIPIGDRSTRRSEDERSRLFQLHDTVSVEHEHCFAYIFDFVRTLLFVLTDRKQSQLLNVYMDLFFPVEGEGKRKVIRGSAPVFSARLDVDMDEDWSINAQSKMFTSLHGMYRTIRTSCQANDVSPTNPGPRWDLGDFDHHRSSSDYSMVEYAEKYKRDIFVSAFGSQNSTSSIAFVSNSSTPGRTRFGFILFTYLLNVTGREIAAGHPICEDCGLDPGMDVEQFWSDPVAALPNRAPKLKMPPTDDAKDGSQPAPKRKRQRRGSRADGDEEASATPAPKKRKKRRASRGDGDEGPSKAPSPAPSPAPGDRVSTVPRFSMSSGRPRASPVNPPKSDLRLSSSATTNSGGDTLDLFPTNNPQEVLGQRLATAHRSTPKPVFVDTMKPDWARRFLTECRAVEKAKYDYACEDANRLIIIPNWVASNAVQSQHTERSIWLEKCIHLFLYHWHSVFVESPTSFVLGYLCVNYDSDETELGSEFLECMQSVVSSWDESRMYLVAPDSCSQRVKSLSVVVVPNGLKRVFGRTATATIWTTGELPEIEQIRQGSEDVYQVLSTAYMGMDSEHCEALRSLFKNQLPLIRVPSVVNTGNLSVLSYLIGLVSDSHWCRSRVMFEGISRDFGVHFLMGSEGMNCGSRLDKNGHNSPLAARMEYFGCIPNMNSRLCGKYCLRPAFGVIGDSKITNFSLQMMNRSIRDTQEQMQPGGYQAKLHPGSARTVCFFFVPSPTH